MRVLAALLALLIAGCGVTRPLAPVGRVSSRGPIAYQPFGFPTPQWDGAWNGDLAVFLPEASASQPCSLYVLNAVVTGTYEGVPFAPTVLDSLTSDSDSFNHSHVTIQVADGLFSCRFDRYYSFGTQSDVMTGWGYALIGEQQFPLWSWFCNDCTVGGKAQP